MQPTEYVIAGIYQTYLPEEYSLKLFLRFRDIQPSASFVWELHSILLAFL